MRKERWIVPVVVVLALTWALAQYIASLLFERELERAMADLQARGDLRVSRSHVQRGWLSSSGTIHLSPLLSHDWHLSLPYEANHGVLDTSVSGQIELHHGRDDRGLFSDTLHSASPTWEAHYRSLGGTFNGKLRLASFVISQSPPGEATRELHFRGGNISFNGVYGDWHLGVHLKPWSLHDGDAELEVGPSQLESRYTYTAGAQSFSQHDQLTIDALSLSHPRVNLEGSNLQLETRTLLDDSELRIGSQLSVGEVSSGDRLLLAGTANMELSRINADALKELIVLLRRKAAEGGVLPQAAEPGSELDLALINLLQDSPRLDVRDVDLDSPMLGLSLKGNGVVIFDARQLGELSAVQLQDPLMRGRFQSRLDGDFEWLDVPAMVALWLHEPLDTQSLTLDLVKGQIRINGRLAPPFKLPR
ncbi:DUF945 family protein [Halomonas binhaiensis]|uniref:DUF945 family protein n=1 Tax=Halomonas binhaiensis TaxID=2562282 RepID=A0A5C1NBX0_9GAMM|nr:DUF945 family protein [Halomonas binhaiensis]QEM80856.1 DUF945 family protein [Halomonas binhaiensis]